MLTIGKIDEWGGSKQGRKRGKEGWRDRVNKKKKSEREKRKKEWREGRQEGVTLQSCHLEMFAVNILICRHFKCRCSHTS